MARVPGHSLTATGDPHDHNGTPLLETKSGRALCKCGWTSDILNTNAARKRAHVAHTDDVARALPEDNDDPFADFTDADFATEVATPDPEKETDDFKEYMRIVLLQQVISDAIADFTKKRRATTQERLNAEAEETGASQFTFTADTIDGETVTLAKVSLSGGEAKYDIDDMGAFTDWLVANRPDLVVITEHPEETRIIPEHTETTPAHTEVVVAPNALKDVTKAYKTVDGKLLNTDTGEFVAGVSYTPASAPTKHTVTWGGTGNPRKKEALERLVNREFAHSTDALVARAALEK